MDKRFTLPALLAMLAVFGTCAGLPWIFRYVEAYRDGVHATPMSIFSILSARRFRSQPDLPHRPDPDPAFPADVLGTADAPMLASGWAAAITPAVGIAQASPQYSVSAPVFFPDPALVGAKSVALGDVSGDGRDDLVFLATRSTSAQYAVSDVVVVLQRPQGGFESAMKVAETHMLASQLLLADMDGDGREDIITATPSGILVLRASADGTFEASEAHTGTLPGQLLATDVDRDGVLDVLIDSHDSHATVAYGDGNGAISSLGVLGIPSSAVRITGDVTNDGLDDLVLATIYNSPLQEFRIYPALATGGYASPVVHHLPPASNQPGSLAIGDFNGDGRNDLALDEARDISEVHLYLQDMQRNLGGRTTVPRHNGGAAMLAFDLDQDGRTDLALAHQGWSYIGYLLRGAAGFQAETKIDAQQYAGRGNNFFAAGDVNSDGCGDLVVARVTQSPVIVFGQGCAAAVMAECRYPPQIAQVASLGGGNTLISESYAGSPYPVNVVPPRRLQPAAPPYAGGTLQ